MLTPSKRISGIRKRAAKASEARAAEIVRAVGYIRVSTEEQVQHGQGLDDGGYLGIIVEVWHDGLCTVAKRSRNGRAVVETEGVPLDSLSVSPITPICATETKDPDWRRV